MINLEAMSGERWSSDEVDFVRDNHGRMDWFDIAIALRRTPAAVIRKAYVMRIIKSPGSHSEQWAARLALLRQLWEAGHSVQEISAMHRTARGWKPEKIKENLRRMGLIGPRHYRPTALKAEIARLYGTMSAKQIGIRLGCSRNVVIGTARDMGLCKPLEVEHERRKGSRKARGSRQGNGVAASCLWSRPQARFVHSDGGDRQPRGARGGAERDQ